MSLDLSSYKVGTNETSSSTKFDNALQAIQDYVNGLLSSPMAASAISGYPSDATKFLNGNGGWTAPGILANRVVAGRVSAGGAVLSGTGFTSTKNSTGKYTVTFTSAFSNEPFVMATCAGVNNGDMRMVSVSTASTTSVQVWMQNSSGTFSDAAFVFCAVLP